MTTNGVFGTWAPRFREKGYWPRPIARGTKASYVPGWQQPDPELPAETLNAWLTSHATDGLGLLMGSPFPDGTRLGAIDVDRDEYVSVVATLLGNPVCGRVGAKGIAFFARVQGPVANRKFRVKGDGGKNWGQVVECLFDRSLCVIPPSIHPKTHMPYRWTGPSLLDITFDQLPIIED